MEKQCEDCIHRVYRKTDELETWPFCACESARMRSFHNDVVNCKNEYVKELILSRKGKLREDNRYSPVNLWSCQVIQTVYNGKCPHKELNN